MLEEFQVMWMETPVHSSDIVATIEVAKAIAPVPVATGERYKRMGMFVDLLSQRSWISFSLRC